MNVLQSSWQDKNGIKLQMQAWEPETKPKAVVGLVHGLGEHVARYSDVARALVKSGFAVMGFDLRGHGRSGGRRGHTPSYETLLDDLGALLERIADRYPRRPVFLYGHSLGGALAINYALRRPSRIRGVIATSPWLVAVVKAPPLKAALARILDPILPTYTDRWAVEPKSLARDPEVGDAYERDPLVHDFVTSRMYLAATEAGQWAMDNAATFPLPLLLMHGTADRVTSWEASREFARRAGRNITWRSWDGWYHELHNEPERSRVVRVMTSWMNGRLEKAGPSRSSAGQMRPRMRKSRPILRKGA